MTFTAEVLAPGAGVDYDNVAEITGSDQFDDDSTPGNGADTDGDGNIGSQDPDYDQDLDDEDDGDNAKVTPQTADLNLVKFVDNATPNVGDIVTFTIRVTNEGPNDATGVSVEDVVPTGYDVVNVQNGGVLAGSTITWSGKNIPNGGAIDLTFTAEVLAPGPGIDFNNVAEITGSDQFDDDSTPGNGADTDGDGNIGSQDSDDDQDADDEDDGDNAYVIPTGSIGDFVWEDLNGNGVQEPGEPGIEGVKVVLQDQNGNPLDTKFTDPSGHYLFDDLEPATYMVKFELPAGYDAFTSDNTGGDDTKDSDADPVTGKTGMIVLASGEDDLTNDAGVFKYASIGDFVWRDDNKDGVQDPGEPGVNDITVKLIKNGSVIATTTTGNHPVTNEPGYYLFDGLVPGDYQIMFNLDTGFGYTDPNTTADDKDSDANPIDGMTTTESLISGEENLTYDAGMKCLLQLDAGANVETCFEESVTLSAVASEGREPYTYEWDNGLGFGPTKVVTPLVTTTYTVTVTDANGCEEVDDVTVTVLERGSIGDRVWFDLDGDGEQDPNETAVANISDVKVELLDVDENVLATTYTNGQGNYIFDDLCPGEYKVKFYLADGYRRFSQENVADDDIDSDPDRNTGITGIVVLHPGENITDVDAGMYKGGALGDYVWIDADGNGVQGADEEGVDGVAVKLFDASTDELLETVITGDDPAIPGIQHGHYQFDDYDPGSYYVQFMIPAGYVFTSPNSGGDVADSDVDGTNGPMTTKTYTINLGEFNRTVDAGIYIPAQLGDYVWEDTDADGIQDPDESGIEGVVVNLYRDLDEDGAPDGPIDFTTTTDANGAYHFDNLPPGNYFVGFEAPTGYFASPQLNNDDLDPEDSDASPVTGLSDLIVLAMGDNNPTVDAGFYQGARLGDYVWEDVDHDGLQDPDEEGIDGVVVELYDMNGEFVGTTTTGINPNNGTSGYYVFDDLRPGKYYVKVVIPEGGYAVTIPGSGFDFNDSDINDANGLNTTPMIMLSSGEINEDVDAGLWRPASIGDYVWEDINADGYQDGSESGINGVTVKLFNAANVELMQTMTTNNPVTGDAGYYHFNNLLPGDYYVQFMVPSDYGVSPADNAADHLDSDVSTVNGPNTTPTVTLNPGDVDDDLDAGLYQCATIGDYVWLENTDSRNGLQDPDESGVKDVIVEAYDFNTGDLYASTVTDANGHYELCLAPGDYYLKFVIPGGMYFTDPNEGSNDEVDSDVDGMNGFGTTQVYTISYHTDNPTVDAGLSSQPMAINLLDITAYRSENHNVVNWTTASETDNDYFVIERRLENETSFSEIARVEAKGNTIAHTTYTVNDMNSAQGGWYFYRLKTVDIYGNADYSPVVTVYVQSQDKHIDVSIYPNPVRDYLILLLGGVEDETEVSYSIRDMGGRLYLSGKQMNSRNHKLTVDVRTLPSGVYNVQIEVEGKQVIQHIAKM